ncbi:hypothetical protein HID58_057726 [Brassica napus]|uniref:Pentatricopeptide repeat-containing protein n=1 Tax=Brassica napus TaxID=3708 RepID=A0ABQ7XFK3_BRANA|nr:hypothetical protein HID58_057726 [Brassica napus]
MYEAAFVITNTKDLVLDSSNRNRLDLFWDVYNEMAERSVVFDVHIYEKLIVAHCRGGNVQLAKDVLLKAEEKFGMVSVAVYGLVNEALCMKGDVDEALELKKRMIIKGLVPSKHILIEGLLKGRDAAAANGLVHEMVSLGMNIDPKIYDSFICVMSKEGAMEKAKALFDGMIASE